MRDERSVLTDKLTAVLGFSELLLEGAYGALERDQKRVLEEIVEAAREMRDVLRGDLRPLPYD
jgi:signal transduction histidine kinase